MTDDARIQRDVAQSAVDMGLSVRETEKAIKRLARKGQQTDVNNKVTSAVDPNIKSAEAKLMRTLSTKVTITPSGRRAGGKIEIEYYTIDDLDRLFQMLVGK